jgi:osmoprotectant transport system ATP-binding protein
MAGTGLASRAWIDPLQATAMPADAAPLFALRGVGKRYGAVTALADIDLAFARGSTTALIGSSGSGKSTLLRLLVGLDWPDAGEVRFDGEPLARARLAAWRRRIGYVIQDGGLFPHLTALQNLALLPRHLGWPASRVAERAAELATLTRFPRDGLGRYPAELSGGQRQRVALMRALMPDPPALLLDEPLGALDPVVRHELQDELKRIFATLGKTVLLVTHDVAEAAYLAPRLVVLRDGRVLQDGRFADLRERPADPFVSRFLDSGRRLPAVAP